MKSYLLVLVIAGMAVFAAQAEVIYDVGPGTGAPTGVLGPYTMTPFPPDPRPLDFGTSETTDVPSPLGGEIAFSRPFNHRRVGEGWATWSHGYTGDVYVTNSWFDVTLFLPPNTGAIEFYVEPGPFVWHTFVAVADDGTSSGEFEVHGQAGATYIGFYATEGSTLSSIYVSATFTFAFGEFAIALADPTIPQGVYLTEDFEDGDLIQNPSWVLQPQSRWSVQADPSDATNLVAQGIQRLSSGCYISFDMPYFMPWAGATIEGDFMVTDATDFGLYLDLHVQDSDQVASAAVGTESGLLLRAPAEADGAHTIAGDGWDLAEMVWHRFTLRYDEQKRQFITTIANRDSGEVIGELAYTPPSAIESIPKIDAITVGIGPAAEGTMVYVDNILVHTMDPPVLGDFDGDGDVDLTDYAAFQSMFTGAR